MAPQKRCRGWEDSWRKQECPNNRHGLGIWLASMQAYEDETELDLPNYNALEMLMDDDFD